MNEKSTYFRSQQRIQVQNPHSYFPLLILYVVTNERVVVDSPSEIRDGVSFKVLETNTKETKK